MPSQLISTGTTGPQPFMPAASCGSRRLGRRIPATLLQRQIMSRGTTQQGLAPHALLAKFYASGRGVWRRVIHLQPAARHNAIISNAGESGTSI
jgi:hypothetical protein